MVREDVLSDGRLSHRDVRVYGVLACARRGCLVSIGERRIGQMAHVDRRSVRASIAKLISCGHLAEEPAVRRGARGRYRLTSALFASIAEPVAPAVVAVSEFAKKPRCPKCGRDCKQVLKAGICRSCNWKLRVGQIARQVAREEIAKSA